MSLTSELIRQGEKDKVWSKYCGYLDLSMDEFMQILERLLYEQKEIWKDSEIGENFLGKKMPKTVQEFGRNVLYVEYKPDETMPLEKVEKSKEKSLKKMHTDFEVMEEIPGRVNLNLARLLGGSFNNLMETARATGAGLAHLKLPHKQPKNHILARLTNLE